MDVIKEYLVSLGFQVDNNEFNRAIRAINDLGQTVQSQASKMAKDFSAASVTMVGALVSVAVAATNMVTQVANADMEYQKLALHMYTTKETAKELKTVLDTMGESMEDIAWIPELRQQYMALMGQAKQMNTPGDAEGQLKSVRGVIFEFRRMKLEATYALQWISYYLLKYLSGPFGDFRTKLKEFNDWIVKSMPEWTNKLARWLAMIFNLLKSVGQFIGVLFNTIKDIFTSLPGSIKLFVAALGLMMAPFSAMFVAVGGILILLEDFFGYMEGRRSSKTLAPMWKRLLEIIDMFKSSSLKTSIKDFFTDIDTRIQDTWELLKRLWREFDNSKLGEDTLKTLTSAFKALESVLKTILTVTGLIWDKFTDLFGFLIDDGVINLAIELLDDLLKTITDIFYLIADLSDEDRKFWEADRFNSPTAKLWKAIKDIISDSIRNVVILGKAVVGVVDVLALAAQGRMMEAAARAKKMFADISAEGAKLHGLGIIRDLAGGSKASASSSGGGADVDQAISAASQQYGVPEDMIRRVIQQESGFQEGIISEAGAIGYMQLMPGTAEALGVDPYSGSENIMGGTKYLAQQYARFGSWEKALAAYNAGPGAVEKYGGVPPYAETQNYVKNIMSGYGGAGVSIGTNASDMGNSYGFTNSYARSGNNGNGGTTIGEVNVNITEPGANQQQIYNATLQAIQDANGKNTARETREFAGVFG